MNDVAPVPGEFRSRRRSVFICCRRIQFEPDPLYDAGTDSAAYRAQRVGQLADGVVSGRLQGRLEVMTQDYLNVYLDSGEWDGRPRFEVMVN